jgi:membrane protease YdiL (CAAX protease family)
MESKRFSSWGDLWVLTVIFFVATLIAGVCMAVFMAAAPDMEQGLSMFIVYTVQFLLAVIGGIVFMRRRDGAKLRFGVSWHAGLSILGGVVLITAASLVLEPLIAMFPVHYLEELNGLIGSGGWTIVTTVVAAPVLEELFFRGIVLENLAKRWNGTVAVLASATLFGIAHAPIWPQALNAFILAILMGYIYLATRSLIPVIIIHAINNGIAYMTLQLTGDQVTDTRQLIGNDNIYWMAYATSAVIVVAFVALLVIKTNNKTPETALHEERE